MSAILNSGVMAFCHSYKSQFWKNSTYNLIKISNYLYFSELAYRDSPKVLDSLTKTKINLKSASSGSVDVNIDLNLSHGRCTSLFIFMKN